MFGSGFQQLESAMVAREQAQGVNASNIANADTPNYHADTRSFADFLSEQLSKRKSGSAATTHRMHFGNLEPSRMDTRFQQAVKTQRMDGNTVDMQKEMARMSENQLMHELTVKLIKGKLGGLANAIKEGSR
ncbi:MAG: flagellar basal body rod protein FlgB [Mariprofundaceae bacterium]